MHKLQEKNSHFPHYEGTQGVVKITDNKIIWEGKTLLSNKNDENDEKTRKTKIQLQNPSVPMRNQFSYTTDFHIIMKKSNIDKIVCLRNLPV